MAAYLQQMGIFAWRPQLLKCLLSMDSYYYSMPKKYTAKHPEQANNSYSHGYREQNSYYKEPHNASVQFSGSPVGITEYLCLTNEDLMYEGNLHRLKNPDFQFILRKITKDLNFLLHFQYEDFWEELEKSQSLKKCLRSCLQILPRKHFGSYIKHKTPTQDPPNQILQDETYRVLGQLMRIVLFLYHRIICEAQQAQLDIVYDEWLLDIPKMFNLIGIYKHNNLKIVNEIIDTAFRVIPHYRDDVVEFIKIMSTVLLNALQLDLSYEYTQKLIKNSKNFNNPMQSFTRNLIKSFVRVFDMFVTLLDFVNLFPVRYVMMLIAEPDFVMELVDRYFQYLTNIEGRWEFTPEFLQRFEPVIHVTRQKMVEFFLRVFDFLDFILAQRIEEEAWNSCLRLYFTLCKEFHCRNESPLGERWETFINVIIAETPHRQVFRLEPFFSHKLDPREMSIIQSCQEYEKEFRKELNRKHFHAEQILELKLMAIKSYKEWNDFENFKEFDLVVENSYRDTTIKEDSILNFLDSEFQKAEFKKHKPNYDPNNLYDLKFKRVNKYPFFADEEYNDEPPFVENEGLEQGYQYPFGMEPLEDLEDAQQSKSSPSEPSTEIQTKQPPRFLKSKHQYENYEKYYNAIPAGPNHNFNSNLSQANQKTKKKYVCLDELSIQYESQQVMSNIKVEKLEHKVSGTIFKRLDEDIGKDKYKGKDKREQKNQEEEVSNLTISVQEDKDQHIENTNQLANLMEEIAKEELSIIEQSADGQRKKVTKYFDADDSKLSKLGSSISGMDGSVDDIEIKEYLKLKDSAVSQNESNLSISYQEKPSKDASNLTGKSTQSKGKKSKNSQNKGKKETKKLVYGQLW